METVNRTGVASPRRSTFLGTRRARIVLVGLTVAVAALGAALVFALGGKSETSSESVVATLRVEGVPGWVTAGEDALWVSLDSDPSEAGGSLVRLDPTGSVEASAPLAGELTFTARAGDAVVVSHFPDGFDEPGELVKLDWTTGAILARAAVDGSPNMLVEGGGALWLSVESDAGASVLRIDPQTLGAIGDPLPVSESRSYGLAYGDGMVWATVADEDVLVRTDPETGRTARGAVGRFPVGVALAGGSVWVANRSGGTVSRVDPETMQTVGEPIAVGGLPSWIVAAAGSVWVASQADGTVTRIDAESGDKVGSPIRVAEPSSVDAAAHAMSAVGDSVWVTSMTEHTVSRIDPGR